MSRDLAGVDAPGAFGTARVEVVDAEVGPNGLTNEALLAIVEDRLEGFQQGRFACQLNAEALSHVRAALNLLRVRTEDRICRGVQGKSQL